MFYGRVVNEKPYRKVSTAVAVLPISIFLSEKLRVYSKNSGKPVQKQNRGLTILGLGSIRGYNQDER